MAQESSSEVPADATPSGATRGFPAEPGPWSWRVMGGTLMLVTDHSGSRVVLLTNGRAFHTRDPKTGILVPLRPEHPAARLTAAAPELLDVVVRLEFWLGTVPDGLAMRDVCRAVIAKAVGRP